MDSVNSGWYVLSNVLGFSSISLWFVALLPQAYANWRRKSADGLSIFFLLLWLIGDTMNLFGCVVLQQRLFQKFLSAYYILLDLVLLAQFFFYRRAGARTSKSTAVSPNSVTLITELDRPLLSKPSLELVDNPANYNSVNTHSVLCTSIKRGWSIRTFSYLAVSTIIIIGLVCFLIVFLKDKVVVNNMLGLYMAWCSSIIYHLSRLPQLWHSYKRQSVEGLSKTMFLVIIGANGLYFSSLSCLIPIINHDRLIRTIPFIYGAFMSFVLDLFVLAQFRIYKSRTNIFDNA